MHIPDSPILKAIHERRSVREFTDAAVVRDLIMTADKKCLDSFEKSTHLSSHIRHYREFLPLHNNFQSW